MPDAFWTGVGTVAAILTSFSFIPQVVKMWQSKSVGDLSPVTFIQFSLGAALWTAYGVHRQDPIVIGANLVVLATLMVALSLYYRHKLSPIQQFILSTLRGAQAIGADTTVAVHDSTHGLIKGIAGNGVDPVQVAQSALEGAITGAQAIGLPPEPAFSAAAAGAIEAAEEIDPQVAERVKEGCKEIAELHSTVGVSSP
jgi:MtN3 and saliva related transmembrane protein